MTREELIWRYGNGAILVVAVLCVYFLGGGVWFFAGMLFGFLTSFWQTFYDPDGYWQRRARGEEDV